MRFRPGPESCMGSGGRMNSGVRQAEPGILRQIGRKYRESWRAHREIKRYAGGSEHRPVADEWMDTAGNGAADESNPDNAESNEGGTIAASAERHDGRGGIAAGSGGE